MGNFLVDNGLPALFLLSFFAATVIPLGSEWLIAALILHGWEVAPVVGVATLGNYLGACTTYLVGLWGAGFFRKKLVAVDEAALAGHRSPAAMISRYGVWSLLLSWLPVIGDPLCLVGGAMRVNFPLFTLLVVAGKLARYAAVAAAVAALP